MTTATTVLQDMASFPPTHETSLGIPWEDMVLLLQSINLHGNSLTTAHILGNYSQFQIVDGQYTNEHLQGRKLKMRHRHTEGTVNYQPRIHKFGILFTPNPLANVWNPSPPNLAINYEDTILLTDNERVPLTSLDPTDVQKDSVGLPNHPEVTVEGDGFGGSGPGGKRLPIDAEGLVLIPGGGGFYISEQYGPYIYRFDKYGVMLSALPPPDTFIPLRRGIVDYSSNTPSKYAPSLIPYPKDPSTGRANNQGFTGLTLSPDGKTLSAVLRSALVQDGGDSAATRRYTRLLTFDVTNHEWPLTGRDFVVPLPVYTDKPGEKRVATQSEIYAVSSTDYLFLTTDSGRGYGAGAENTESLYRQIDVVSLDKAHHVHAKPYDMINGAVAPGGILAPNIKPAEYCPFIDINNYIELGKFGLHNGGTEDTELLNQKWESLATGMFQSSYHHLIIQLTESHKHPSTQLPPNTQ